MERLLRPSSYLHLAKTCVLALQLFARAQLEESGCHLLLNASEALQSTCTILQLSHPPLPLSQPPLRTP